MMMLLQATLSPRFKKIRFQMIDDKKKHGDAVRYRDNADWMDHNIDLILRLTGALGFALVLGFVTQKLKLSPIVGYLLAGVIVGPFTPGFVADPDIATQTAEIGVILLMFGVGIHFHLKDLLAVRNVAIPGAIVQIATATALSALATNMFLDWSWNLGVVFGIAVSVASTVVLTRYWRITTCSILLSATLPWVG
jgi:predicted Kef-type K+ transport protein